MQITIVNITPFLGSPIPEADMAKVGAWLTSISATLNKTYGLGATLDADVAPAVYDIVAGAITRRLARGTAGESDGRIRSQTTGPSSVTYNTDVTALSGWFWAGELGDLGALLGNGGSISSVATSAPDGIRFGNIARDHDYDELYEGDPVFDDSDLVESPAYPGLWS